MPWVWILVLIVGVYLVVKAAQGIRDFMSWYAEGRAFDKERQRLDEERRKRHHQATPPSLKERPTAPTKPPKRGH